SLSEGQATGFAFDQDTPEALMSTITRAATLFHEPQMWRRMMRCAMSADFSWEAAARRYISVYHELRRIWSHPFPPGCGAGNGSELPAKDGPFRDACVGRFDLGSVVEAHAGDLDEAALGENSQPRLTNRDDFADLVPAHGAESRRDDLASVEQVKLALAE